jgi:hypothetical protein
MTSRQKRIQPWFNSFELSDREHTRRAILSSRFRRRLPVLAQRLRIDIDLAFSAAERSFFLCATCFGPMPSPVPYCVDGELRGFLCGRCDAAIKACEADPARLCKHRRFKADRAMNRRRLARFLGLHSLPVEALGKLLKDQIPDGQREAADDAQHKRIAR